MKRSSVIRLVSIESLTNPRITDTPRFPKIKRSSSAELIKKLNKETKPQLQPDLRAEFALTGAVYSAWTHGTLAPWMISKDNPTAASSIRLHGKPTVGRFDQQLRGVTQCKAMKDVNFFCGTSGTLYQIKRPRQAIFHICMVLWAPGFLTAIVGKPVSDSFELELFSKIQNEWDKNRKEHQQQQRQNKNKEVPILNISLAYVVPRRRTSRNIQQAWKTSTASGGGSFTNHISKCEPKVLACGVWQLGLRLCLLKPDVVVGIGSDAIRVLAAISELSPGQIIKNTAATLGPLEQTRAMAYESQMKIQGLTRKVFSGEASPQQTTHYLTHNFDLFRLPHPFTMRGPNKGRRQQKPKPQDHELQQQVSLGQFRSTMDLIFRFAVQQQNIQSTTETRPPTKRICIRFPPSGGHTTAETTKKNMQHDPIKEF